MNRKSQTSVFAVLAVVISVPLFAATSSRKAVQPEVVAFAAGQPVTAAEVDDLVATKMFRLRTDEFRMRSSAIQEIIDKRLVAAEAARRGISVDELLHQEVDGKIEVPTADQVRMVYDATKDRFSNVPEEAALNQIAANLRSQRSATRRSEFVNSLRSNANVRVLLEPPRLPVEAGSGPVRGPATAPVTIVEYSDFECPYCGRASATVAEVLKKYPTQVRLVFHHFPLPIHRSAQLAAKAASCAGEQGKFWEMHDMLFLNQSKLTAPDLVVHANSIGLDGARFTRCMGDDHLDAALTADHASGESYGVTGTPAFFINGRLVQGAAPLAMFTTVIDDEIARTARASTDPKKESSVALLAGQR
ncbi:MAG: thioredoxin domain-containing protein [Acidobacteria bacterium]|nr:thioredoxin domain-containing protein [Acidobacteriota bacterium]MBV9070744.1 thioredoxin domain-containing protein [Acidobacteriota bacterium]MBV9186097.1 thioredoxin domain-containing protein [Acidobacteriota bacterium]